MTAFHLVSVTRVVVFVHQGSGALLAVSDRDGPEELSRVLKQHAGATIIYDGPPNQDSRRHGSKVRRHETMTSVMVGGFGVRVWCAADALAFGPDLRVTLELQRITRATREKIVEALNALGHVAAYEILDANGNGGIVRADRP